MALGGGIFTTQNKILPGTYINFVSAAKASAILSDRGIAAIPVELDWGAENQMFPVENSDFHDYARQLFGYLYTDDAMLPMREIFRHAKKAFFFRLNKGGALAENAFATAKYPGTRGNALTVKIEANENSTEAAPLYNITTYMDTVKVDIQTAISNAEELQDNEYIIWNDSATLQLTAGTPLTGGANGSVDNAAYQEFLDQAESYSFHVLACPSTDVTIKALFAAFTKRMRDEVGKKFQCVMSNHLADNEGIISIKNGIIGEKNTAALVPWVTGAIAGVAVNASVTNMLYDGELDIDTVYTQAQLEAALKEGSFIFHNVDGEMHVLRDINTFVSVSKEKSADFAQNQTIRVLDQIANDIAVLFADKYIGKIPNDAAGCISLWNDIVTHHNELQDIRAIENFNADDVTVSVGDAKRSVSVSDCVTPVNCMEQLYMTVYVA